MNSLCTLKVRFKCLQRAINLNVDIHPGVLDPLFLLSKLEVSNLQKKQNPDQRLALTLRIKKRVQPTVYSCSIK